MAGMVGHAIDLHGINCWDKYKILIKLRCRSLYEDLFERKTWSESEPKYKIIFKYSCSGVTDIGVKDLSNAIKDLKTLQHLALRFYKWVAKNVIDFKNGVLLRIFVLGEHDANR